MNLFSKDKIYMGDNPEIHQPDKSGIHLADRPKRSKEVKRAPEDSVASLVEEVVVG